MSAPGWYAEPGQPNVERYWDGFQWTPQTRGKQAMAESSGYGASSFQPTPAIVDAKPTWSTSVVVGALVSAISAALVLFSYLTGTWATSTAGDFDGVSFDFSDLRHLFAIDTSGDAPAMANAYFSWLGWVLFAAVVLLLLVSYAPTPAQTALRLVGMLVSGAAIVLTLASVAQFGGLSNYIRDVSGAGFWLAISGFAVMALGAGVSAF